MKKILAILWILGVLAVVGKAQDEDEDMDFDEDYDDEDDGCSYHCEENAKDEDVCCEGKTCKSFKGFDYKFCLTPEEYQEKIELRKSFGLD